MWSLSKCQKKKHKKKKKTTRVYDKGTRETRISLWREESPGISVICHSRGERDFCRDGGKDRALDIIEGTCERVHLEAARKSVRLQEKLGREPSRARGGLKEQDNHGGGKEPRSLDKNGGCVCARWKILHRLPWTSGPTDQS